MTNAENGKKYSIIAAICFAVLAVYYVISDIVYYSGNEYSSLSFLDILSWSIAIGFAVTLFLKNKFAVTIVAGIYALLHVYYIVRYFSLYNFLGFLAILLIFLAIVAVGVILALSLKNNQITKKIWFIGAALLFVGTLMLWIQGRYFEYISVAWKAMLSALVEIVAFLFVGLWVKESITSGQTAPVNEYATFNPQTYSNQTASNDAIGGADKLKMYKELLDSGTITQEEFDAKKKQILGLYRGLIIEKENIIIKGTPKKNKVALIILLSGIAVAVISFIVASYYFNNVDGYEYFGFGYGGWYTYRVIYDFDFFDFYFSEFFGSCIHGYMLIAGIIAIIVGLIMKFNTEKCEITVTNNRILGKLAHGKEVNIPLNQITGLHSCSFDGVSVASIGNVSAFHCIANYEEVMKAISFILANPQGMGASMPQRGESSAVSSSTNEEEQLKRFKNLLDSDIITQEEFDAKKKEILGL